MPARRLPTLLAALLAAVILAGVAAPVADAALPRARQYHVGGKITLDTNLLSRSGTSAWAIDEYLRANTPLPALGAAFMAAEEKHGVNARFLLAAAMHESGWGTSSISRFKKNLFGYNAYDRDPGRYASAFRGYASGIDAVAKFMKRAYLTPGGRWWSGRPTLRAMQRYWSSSGSWGERVSRIANSIRLETLRGRSLKFSAPVVRDGLNGGERATVQLRWTGGAIPARLEFVATWVPVILDAEMVDASGGASAAKPLTVKTRRSDSEARAITLAVAAPQQPGRYRLQVEMRDVKGGTLPRSDRIAIPQADVRVWGDHAVGVTVVPGPDGSGVTIRIKNTGRKAIPAVPDWASSVPSEDEIQDARTTVTVTATSVGLAEKAPVVLLAVPLADALEPGESVAFDVPAIGAATARAANWLSVDLRLHDDPAWANAYLPVGILHSASTLGELTFPTPPRPEAQAVTGTQPGSAVHHVAPATSAIPTVAPTVRTSPTAPPSPAPTDKPNPVAAPSPVAVPIVMPAPSPIATSRPTPAVAPTTTPAPTPSPSPQAKAAPTPAPTRAPVTGTASERSRTIRYRGGWDSAPHAGYMGGRVAWSKDPGATATFTFTGSSVKWVGPLGPTRGRAVVLIDGRAVARVNLWNSSFVPRAVVFKRTFKNTGRHTLTIRVLSSRGRQTVAIDGFIVR
jgi:outer membrane biosynthesis protein TonB